MWTPVWVQHSTDRSAAPSREPAAGRLNISALCRPNRSRVCSESECTWRARAREREIERQTNSCQARQTRTRDRTCASCGEGGSRHHGQEPTRPHRRCTCAADQSAKKPVDASPPWRHIATCSSLSATLRPLRPVHARHAASATAIRCARMQVRARVL